MLSFDVVFSTEVRTEGLKDVHVIEVVVTKFLVSNVK